MGLLYFISRRILMNLKKMYSFINELSLCHKLQFSNPVSWQSDGVNLCLQRYWDKKIRFCGKTPFLYLLVIPTSFMGYHVVHFPKKK